MDCSCDDLMRKMRIFAVQVFYSEGALLSTLARVGRCVSFFSCIVLIYLETNHSNTKLEFCMNLNSYTSKTVITFRVFSN